MGSICRAENSCHQPKPNVVPALHLRHELRAMPEVERLFDNPPGTERTMMSLDRPAAWKPAEGDLLRERPFDKEVGQIAGETYHLAGDPAGPVRPAPLPEEERTPGEHTPTVLVVEDDEATRLAMTTWLAGEGFLVLTAADGHEAAGHLERPLEPIDVVVLDVGLPDVDGIALCERVRQLYPRVPVVVCTGQAEPADVARLVELGISRYFRKPIDPDELLAAVEASLP
jgi:CheY-like chemotaxis protein